MNVAGPICPLDSYLEESGKSLRQVAKAAGLPAGNLSLFRRRKRTLRIESLEALSKATGLKVRELLLWMAGVADEPSPKKPAKKSRRAA